MAVTESRKKRSTGNKAELDTMIEVKQSSTDSENNTSHLSMKYSEPDTSSSTIEATPAEAACPAGKDEAPVPEILDVEDGPECHVSHLSDAAAEAAAAADIRECTKDQFAPPISENQAETTAIKSDSIAQISVCNPSLHDPPASIETIEKIAAPATLSPHGRVGHGQKDVAGIVPQSDDAVEIADEAVATEELKDSFNLSGMMEPDEYNTSGGGHVPKRPPKDGLEKWAGGQRLGEKQEKSGDKMKMLKATPSSPIIFSPPATPKKPLMDLRHILKKHEKKTETQQMFGAEDHCDFYGSMSSIPFLKINKPEKTKKGGTRVKDKRSKKAGAEASSPHEDDGKGKKKISIVTEGRDGQKRTTEVTVIQDYDEDDLSMWKSMSALNGSFMEEVSDRPRDMLPLVPSPSPKKEEEKPAPQHNHRGFHRPDDWVEFGHPQKRSPVKINYKTKAVRDATSIDAPSVFNDGEGRPKAVHQHVPKPTPSMFSEGANVSDKGRTEPGSESSMEFREPLVSPPARPTTADSSKVVSPSRARTEPELVNSHTGGHSSPDNEKSTEKTDKRKVHQVTELTIQFHDGCVVNGHFRPKESVQRVIRDLTRDVLRNDMLLPSFDLFDSSPNCAKKKLDPTMTLEELDLVPSAKVYVAWTKPMAVTTMPGWYLLDEDEVPATN
jgi:UBX domain